MVEIIDPATSGSIRGVGVNFSVVSEAGMCRLLLLLLLLVFCAPVFPQTKRPFTFEDMMSLKRIEEPVVSPDGRWVLFAAVDVNLTANTKTPHVWIVPLAGGQEKEIIAGQSAEIGRASCRERVLRLV